MGDGQGGMILAQTLPSEFLAHGSDGMHTDYYAPMTEDHMFHG